MHLASAAGSRALHSRALSITPPDSSTDGAHNLQVDACLVTLRRLSAEGSRDTAYTTAHTALTTHTARPCVTAYTFISLTPGVSSFARHTLLAGAHKLHHVTKVSTRCGFAPANDPCRVRVPRGGERWSRAKQTTRPPPRTHDAHRGSQHPSGMSSLIQIGRCPHLGSYRPRRDRAGRGTARPCALA